VLVDNSDQHAGHAESIANIGTKRWPKLNNAVLSLEEEDVLNFHLDDTGIQTNTISK
jgi:hypothetical protein